MSKDPNTIDIDDYYELSSETQVTLDKWLKSVGGDPVKTRSIHIDRAANKVFTEEYLFDTSGNLVYDKKAHDIEVHHKAFTYTTEPPVWK